MVLAPAGTVCTHLQIYFVFIYLNLYIYIYILKDHINKHACAKFDASQGSMIPISAHEELRMHLRH